MKRKRALFAAEHFHLELELHLYRSLEELLYQITLLCCLLNSLVVPQQKVPLPEIVLSKIERLKNSTPEILIGDYGIKTTSGRP